MQRQGRGRAEARKAPVAFRASHSLLLPGEGALKQDKSAQGSPMADQFLSPEHSQLRFLDAGLRDSSGQPVDLLVCSLNVFGDGIGCSAKLSELPT